MREKERDRERERGRERKREIERGRDGERQGEMEREREKARTRGRELYFLIFSSHLFYLCSRFPSPCAVVVIIFQLKRTKIIIMPKSPLPGCLCYSSRASTTVAKRGGLEGREKINAVKCGDRKMSF